MKIGCVVQTIMLKIKSCLENLQYKYLLKWFITLANAATCLWDLLRHSSVISDQMTPVTAGQHVVEQRCGQHLILIWSWTQFGAVSRNIAHILLPRRLLIHHPLSHFEVQHNITWLRLQLNPHCPSIQLIFRSIFRHVWFILKSGRFTLGSLFGEIVGVFFCFITGRKLRDMK